MRGALIRLLLPLLFLLSLLLVSGCNTDGDGSGGAVVNPGTSPVGTGRFLLRDATVDELLSFSAEVNGVAVVYDDDTVSDNLLDGPFRCAGAESELHVGMGGAVGFQ